MEEQIPHTSSFPFKEDIVCFFDLTLIGESAEDLGNRLKYFIRESFLKAGYSRVMTGHSNLRRQYIQATLALDVGGRKMALSLDSTGSTGSPSLIFWSRAPGGCRDICSAMRSFRD